MATQITCRIEQLDDSRINDGLEAKSVVFMKTSEEAKCVDPKCKWTYTSSVPTLTGITTTFDTTDNVWKA